MKKVALVLSCEHAVNTVPETYKTLFAAHQKELNSHRAIDHGALEIALTLYKNLHCDYVQAEATRLLIDLNRSPSHRQCFSEFSSPLPKEEKERLIQCYYLPFRQRVEGLIKKQIQQGKQVLHLSIHSFTANFNGQQRRTALGLLYDPNRLNESLFARRWQEQLKQQDRRLRVRRNYPYRGTSDGFTKELRKRFADEDYAGIELELNQELVTDSDPLDYLGTLLCRTIRALIG